MSSQTSFEILDNPAFFNTLTSKLLQNTDFLTSLARNKTFVNALSQNKDFVTSLSQNTESRVLFDSLLLTSELKPIQRIAETEAVTGLNDYSEFEEDHAPTLPEQITMLSEKVESLSESTGAPIKHPDNIPTGKTEIRACKLVERLKEARETAGNKFLSSNDIVNFLKNGLDEALRVKEGQNVRQIKKEVLEKAVKMFPGSIFISQKTTGRKNLRLVLKT